MSKLLNFSKKKEIQKTIKTSYYIKLTVVYVCKKSDKKIMRKLR